MAALLHSPFPRSPNPSTKSYASSASSAASPTPAVPAAHQFTTGTFKNTNTSARSTAGSPAPQVSSMLTSPYAHSHLDGQRNRQSPQQQSLPPPPQLQAYAHLPPYPQHQQHYQQQQQQQQQYSFHPFQSHAPVTTDAVMGRDSQPPSDSVVNTPVSGYIALPPLHHGGGSSSGSGVSPLHGVGSSTLASQQQQQQHQHQQQMHMQKRAYRQRRKDPSCDACRERKVKCDATETTSCSECSNRQVKCQFTKETNRRMSSIKQMQDLERQLDRTRRENNSLRRLLQERSGSGSGGSSRRGGDGPGGSAGSAGQLDLDTEAILLADQQASPLRLPEIGVNPRRRRARPQRPTSTVPIQDLGRARANLRNFAKGIWTPPAPHGHGGSATTDDKPTPADLPPRPAVDLLLQAYYTSIHSMFPMLHWPTFRRAIEQLYAEDREGPAPSDSFLAVFFAVLAVGRLFCAAAENMPAADDLAEAAGSRFDSWSNEFVLDDARALLLLVVFLNESNLKTAAWAWLGHAVRIGQDLGLYLEPTAAAAGGGFVEAEMRRRVWWAIYILDHSLAVELGRPALINDDDCDVALPAVFDDHFLTDDVPGGISVPPGSESLTHSLVAVLNVVRSYPALNRCLLSPFSPAAPSSSSLSTSLSSISPLSMLSLSSRLTSSSPLSTPSPASAVPANTPTAAAAAATPGIPTTHLATFDQHFAACLRVFPPACDLSSSSFSSGTGATPPPLSAHIFAPLTYLLHARLLLHRANLAPSCPSDARLSAIEQCTHTALETASLVARVPLDELGSGAGAIALVATHLFRCALFALLAGYIDAAAALVRGLAAVASVRFQVATPCGRFLAFFASCLGFKRAECAAYLARTAATQGNGNISNGVGSPSVAQLHDVLMRDEELLVYVSSDLQAAPENTWVWEGETVTATPASTASRGHHRRGRLDSQARSSLTEEESRDWGGWERLESRVRGLATSSTSSTSLASTAATTAPPQTSHSTTTSNASSPIAHHYTHQMFRPPLLAMGQAPPHQPKLSQESNTSAGAEPRGPVLGRVETPSPVPSSNHERIRIINII